MSLPASGTISIDNIRTELQEAQGNNSLNALSEKVGFSTPDAMSEFHGYSYINYNTFAIVNTPYSTAQEACDDRDEDNLVLYFAGLGGTPACPNTGVILYTDSSLTTVYNGDGQWYKSNECLTSYNILTEGMVEGIYSC